MAYPTSPGALVAAVLASAWRHSHPPLKLSASELETVTPLLVKSGAAALGWWRIRDTELRDSPAAGQLRQVYRLYTLKAPIIYQGIAEVLTLFQAAGLEVLLVKGWAAARLYPEAGLRPLGDVDLCVRPDQYRAAEALLKSPEGRKHVVDLHWGIDKMGGGRFEEFYSRSQPLSLRGVEVRVPGPEDHLRFLCLHLLRHGAWRPLWLCDVAAALESRPEDFDWDLCLGSDRRRADWVACTIGLAHQLLGARVDDTPVAARASHLPSWLVPTILKQWELRSRTAGLTPAFAQLRHPLALLKDLRHRWPNAIEGTVGTGGPFNELPRLPFQLGDCLLRAARSFGYLPKLLRKAE